jgi:hypothetical protein
MTKMNGHDQDVYSVEAVTDSLLKVLEIPPDKTVICGRGCPHAAGEFVAAMVAHACIDAAEKAILAWEARKQ